MILLKHVSTSRGIITIIAAILILFGGVFAYQYFFVKTQPIAQQQEQLIGGDKDSHGCLPAAGYSWCEIKQKCLRVWEEPCETDLTGGWKIYTNSGYNFSIKYPTTASLTENNEDETWYGGTYQIAIKTITTVSIPNAESRDAFVIFYVANGQNAINNCYKQNLNAQGAEIIETQEINGTVFHVANFGDAAMGGKRDSVSQYSVLKNNLCYILQGNATWTDIQFVHGATDGKLATQQELEAQNQKIRAGQDFVKSIISTFKFTN